MNFRRFLKREFWTKKKIVWSAITLIAVLLIGSRVLGGGGGPSKIQTDTAKKQHVQQTVLSTGQVVSNTDLSLSFQTSGVVRHVFVREGQKVGAGATLATLDQASVQASLTSARGSLAQAKANYDRVLAGSSSEDVRVSEAAVATAKTTVANAYSAMLNSGLTAIPDTRNSSDGTIAVSGAYNDTAEGDYVVTIEGLSYRVWTRNIDPGLKVVSKLITTGAPVPLGTHGLFITFSATGSFSNNDQWVVSIPNTQAPTYLASKNAYESAKKALDQAEASLALKKAEARPPDVEAAQAQVLSAQGQVAAAQAAYNNTILRAPSAGTITKVDTKAGEQAVASQEVMVLQDVGNLHAEANVSEADIASIKVGQSVDYTFDALGPDRHFTGKVEAVNPGPTVISGVVNYKVTASIDDAPDIKPGMTANMTVLVAEKADALVVPSNAVINKDGRKYVRVVDDPKKKTYHEVEVQTGLAADGGLVEIISGLSDGQEVVVSLS